MRLRRLDRYLSKFQLDDQQQLRETLLHGAPNKVMLDLLIIVPMDISSTPRCREWRNVSASNLRDVFEMLQG